METYKKLSERLCLLQAKLKAPKGQFNSYGQYKYRSCEDIVEAVKPLLGEIGAHLMLSDEIVLVGERYYVKATATIATSSESIAVTAFAREPLARKGMDESQLTGTASSYARKYALNGLFAIDDTRDADTMKRPEDEYEEAFTKKPAKPATEQPVPPPPIHKPQAAPPPSNRPTMTQIEKSFMQGLFDYYETQKTAKVIPDKILLCDKVWESLGRWPATIEDCNFVKQYVTIIDIARG